MDRRQQRLDPQVWQPPATPAARRRQQISQPTDTLGARLTDTLRENPKKRAQHVDIFSCSQSGHFGAKEDKYQLRADNTQTPLHTVLVAFSRTEQLKRSLKNHRRAIYGHFGESRGELHGRMEGSGDQPHGHFGDLGFRTCGHFGGNSVKTHGHFEE
jgi:hypothetical protein